MVHEAASSDVKDRMEFATTEEALREALFRSVSTFTIKHDTQRYGDTTTGLKRFGERFVVSGITAEQAEEIAGALTNYFDAGLDEQYIVETAENTPSLAVDDSLQAFVESPFKRHMREVGERIDEATKADGSVTVSAGQLICPHGHVEVYCRECDLKARVALHDAVALAVMEERARCARIVASYNAGNDDPVDNVLDIIAAKIGSGEE